MCTKKAKPNKKITNSFSASRRLQFPLFFKATNQELNITIACRAYEFHTQPGMGVFSESLMKQLIVDDGSLVHLELVPLPKATYLSLKAEDGNYLQWSNQKAVLEHSIKKYGTLTLNTTISLEFDGKSHLFEVTKLQPANHVTIIDTDVVVDLEGGEPIKPLDFEMNENEKPKLQKNNKKKRRKRGEKLEEPEEEQPKQSFIGAGKKIHSITNPSNEIPGINSKQPVTNLKSATQNTAPATTNVNVQKCQNCTKDIPKSTFAMHEAFCSRNNYYCSICDLVMPKSKENEHFETTHKNIKCSLCDEEVEPNRMDFHLEKTCRKRKIHCKHCQLRYPVDDHQQHEYECGSRTEQCENCFQYIKLMDFEDHQLFCLPEVEEEDDGVIALNDDDRNGTTNFHYEIPNLDELEEESESENEKEESMIIDNNNNDLDDEKSKIHEMEIDLNENLSKIINYLKTNGNENIENFVKELDFTPINDEKQIKLFLTELLNLEENNLEIILKNPIIYLENYCFPSGKTLLQFAVENGFQEAVEFILENISNINICQLDSNGNSLLHLAAFGGFYEIFEFLLSNEKLLFQATSLNNDGKDIISCCLESDRVSSLDKSSFLSVLIENIQINSMHISENYNQIIKDAVCEELMLCYWKNMENEQSFIHKLLFFLNGRSSQFLNEVKSQYLERISENFSPLTCSVHSSVENNNLIHFDVINDGNHAFNIELIFPSLDCHFSVISPGERTLKPKEKTKFSVQYKVSNDTLFFIKCENTNSFADKGTFYALLPVQ